MLQRKKKKLVQSSTHQMLKRMMYRNDIIDLLPIAIYRKKSHGVINDSLGLRGGRSIISKSGGLKPRAVAGKPSVTKFTQSN
jgi:hypothetical protein